MDNAPEAKVVDVLDQRLRQLGLIGKTSRSSSQSSSNVFSSSRGKSRSVSGSSIGSSSTQGSRGRSRLTIQQNRNKNIKK